MTATTLGLILMLLGLRPAQEVFVPGPLSSGHAELLMHQGADRCAACHPAAHQSFGNWVGQLVGLAPASQTTQTQLCMECHQQTMNSSLATFAHNLPPEQLLTRTQLVSTRKDLSLSITDGFLKADFQAGQTMACATCHREHHGLQVDMKAMTNQQCQSCHTDSIGHFGTHPDFQLMAGSENPAIQFDHVSHGKKHFVQASKEFQCAQCHVEDSQGNVQRLASYQTACASCHDGSLNVAVAQGVPFLQLPMIDPEAVRLGKVDFGSWPADLSQDFDGQLGAMTRLLLEADPVARQALAQLGDRDQWMDLDPDSEMQMEAVGQVLLGLKRLLVDLSARGGDAVRHRIQAATEQTLDPEQALELSRGVSAEWFQEAAQRWFPAILDEVKLEDCFPVYRVAEEGMESSRQVYLTLPESVLGRLGLRQDQHLLAPNPLANTGSPAVTGTADQANLKVIGPPGASKPALPSESIPSSVVNASPAILQSSVSQGGEVLAENPLLSQAGNSATSGSGTTVRDVPSSAGNVSVSQGGNGTRPVASAQNLAREGGDWLADNPLAKPNDSAPTVASATTTATPGTEVVMSPTPEPPVPSLSDSSVGKAVDALEAKQFADRISEHLRLAGQTSTAIDSGWRRDDLGYRVQYLPQGHQDSWLKGWLQLAATQRAKPGVGQATMIRLYGQMLAMPATQSCLQCHNGNQQLPATPIEHPDNLVAQRSQKMMGAVPVVLASASQPQLPWDLTAEKTKASPPTVLAPFRQISAVSASPVAQHTFSWKANHRDPDVRGFTDFNHRPHTLQSGLTTCQQCHQLKDPQWAEPVAFRTQGMQQRESDFHPITRSQCASCHGSGGVSDGCTTCHNYHVGSRRLNR